MADTETYDIVLAGGRAIDPETYMDGIYHIAIKDGSIAAVSLEPLDGTTVVDVSGKIVSPGFIDLHAHGQNIASNRIQAYDGLTTALELEAGLLPVGEFYGNCAREGRPINYGCSAGWMVARAVTIDPELAVDGKPVPSIGWSMSNFGIPEWVDNPSHGDQLQGILDLIEQGLKEGGIGIGTAWGYAPGAGLKEMRKVWELAKKYERPTYTHIQNLSMLDPNSGVRNIIELIGLAASTGAQTHICHWNSASLRDIPTIRDIVKNAQDAGLPVTTEAYVYGAGNSGIGAAEFDPKDVEDRMAIEWSDFTLVKNMHDFASKEEFVAARDANPGDSVIVHFLREDDNPHDASLLDQSVMFPGTSICTDGLPHVRADGSFFEEDVWPLPDGLNNHPRASGNYCRFLRKWVRERGVMSWMDAIRAASLNGAQIIEDSCPMMKKKGRIQVGADADIIVFDPETVSEQADFQTPVKQSKGMHHVIINGTFLIRDEELDPTAFPGQAVRAPIVN